MQKSAPQELVHTAQDAIILCLLTAAAVDGAPQNAEITLIEAIANTTPALAANSSDDYARMMEIGLALIGGPEGLESMFSLTTRRLNAKERETCFAIVVEFIARNGKIAPEEMRFLDLLSDHFSLDKLTRAAIEKSARIRLDPLTEA
jgi:hypothetical protein